MTLLKESLCTYCGAKVDPREAVDGVLKCRHCGTFLTVPKPESKVLSFLQQGEHDLDSRDFDRAYEAYAKAAEHDPEEPEAYFGMALATFKVQYLKDEVRECLQPICYDVSEKVFTDDRNYRKALQLATSEQKRVYRERGYEIDIIRDEFYSLQKSGLDYDCFLCVKVTTPEGGHTADYDRANDIYYHLKDNGYKPFFSEREMKGREGSAYEALILYALYMSECMLIVCSNEEYLQTKWVKNEYLRFLQMMKSEEKERDALTFVFYGKPIEKLPNGKKIQGIDLSRPDAYPRITNYVETHTPEARARREASKSKYCTSCGAENPPAARFCQSCGKTEFVESTEEAIRIITERKVRAENEEKLKAAQEAVRKAEEKRRAEERKREEEMKALREQLAELRAQRDNAAQEEKQKRRAEESDGGRHTWSVICRYCANEFLIGPNDPTPESCPVCAGASWIIKEPHAQRGHHAWSVICQLCAHEFLIGPNDPTPERCPFCGGHSWKIKEPHAQEDETKRNTEEERKAQEESERKKQEEAKQKPWLASDYPTLENYDRNLFKINGTTLVEFLQREFQGEVCIPRGVTSIGNGAFYCCEKLTSITIPDSVTSVIGYAFSRCSGLTSVTIGNGVTLIDIGAFKYCDRLNKVYFKGSKAAWEKIRIGSSNDALKNVEVVFSLDEAARKAQAEPTRKETPLSSFEIENGVLKQFIGNETKVVIPDGVTTIGRYAFNDCYSLTSITIPNSVTSIGDDAFHGCSGLTSITFPDSVTKIGESAFHSCSGLTTLSVSENNPTYYSKNNCIIERKSKTLVAGCKTSIIPDDVTAIGQYAFYACDRLTSITIPDSVTSIDARAFAFCRRLTSIVIPGSVTSIGDSAFVGCSELKIYCKHYKGFFDSRPYGWHKKWNPDHRPVKWDYNG